MIGQIVRLGVLNVLRRRGRSLTALAAIGFGVVALLIAGGFVEWILSEMRELSIRTWYGHVQIAREDYWEKGAADPEKYLVDGTPAVIAQLRNDPRVLTVAPRIRFAALASHDETTLSFLGEGVDPAAEEAFGRSLIFLRGRGSNLSDDGSQSAVLGQGLAANLDATVANKVVLLGNTAAGGVNAIEVHVRGVFLTANQAFDDSTLRLPLPLAQHLLRVDGVHSWTILLRDSADTNTVVANIRSRAQQEGLEVRAWTELAQDYLRTEALFSRQFDAMAFVLGLLIVLGIWNTMTMSVMERTAEIGTAMALGAPSRRVLMQFVTEGAILGVAGGLVGVAVGVPLAWLLSWTGIPLPPPPGLDTPIVAAIRLDAGLVMHAFLISLATATIASIIPAIRASRLPVVDALRTAHV